MVMLISANNRNFVRNDYIIGLIRHKTCTLLALFEKRLALLDESCTNSRYLLAVSGGMDSTALADLCARAKLQFALVHVNYHLRGEDSIQDEEFVKSLGSKYQVEVFINQADLSEYTGNIQTKARNLRYAYFKELLKRHRFDFVMTAHHMDDVAETFLFNAGRGTGIQGLIGIPASNEQIIRPLLGFYKQTIIEYITERDLKHREDSSNASSKYARNFLRHRVIPKLKEQNPNFLDGVKKTMGHLQATQHFAEQGMNAVLKIGLKSKTENRIVYNVEIFRTSAFSTSLAWHLLAKYGFTSGQVIDFFSNTEWVNGAKLLADQWELIYDRECLILSKLKLNKTSMITFDPRTIKEIQFNEYHFSFTLTTQKPKASESKTVAFFDAKKISNICLRYWKTGDRIQPRGMAGKSKTLKKFFIDQKFALDKKNNTPILLHEEEIMWIVPYRTDQRYYASEDTDTYLKVEVAKT